MNKYFSKRTFVILVVGLTALLVYTIIWNSYIEEKHIKGKTRKQEAMDYAIELFKLFDRHDVIKEDFYEETLIYIKSYNNNPDSANLYSLTYKYRQAKDSLFSLMEEFKAFGDFYGYDDLRLMFEKVNKALLNQYIKNFSVLDSSYTSGMIVYHFTHHIDNVHLSYSDSLQWELRLFIEREKLTEAELDAFAKRLDSL